MFLSHSSSHWLGMPPRLPHLLLCCARDRACVNGKGVSKKLLPGLYALPIFSLSGSAIAVLSKHAFEPSKSKSITGTHRSPTLISQEALPSPCHPPPWLFALVVVLVLVVELCKSPSAHSTVTVLSNAAAVCTGLLPFRSPV